MEFFGYTKASAPADECHPVGLTGVTISASPVEITAIAQFLPHCAKEIEALGEGVEHEHFACEREGDPPLLVFNPGAGE